MVKIEKKQILINGEPKLILAGEVHYFRLKKQEWQDRLTKLKEAGFNTVATYIPWICHEEREGKFDFDGHTREELDLIAFLDLCRANNLYLIARPGPFVMAELKNEGIPHWVSRKYPETRPVSWDGEDANNTTLDYLAPNFLTCVKKWYAQVMPILSRYLESDGGNLIGVQLDNEIGMISWCCNKPDLTDWVLADFREYLKEQYSGEELAERYPFWEAKGTAAVGGSYGDEAATGVSDSGAKAFASGVRSPQESYALALHRDLGYYMRRRTVKYVELLAGYAKEYGIHDVPFLINIHGTAGGRGLPYPIGISQLYEAYTMSDEFLSGSDIYLGSLTMDNFQDLYILNTYMEAVNRENQPLASFEFECGDGNYGETFETRTDVSAVDFKARMCIAQGNKALNCYLFCGGYNYRLMDEVGDGNNRIAFTGERHGFAAPVNPEGKLNYTFPRMAEVMHLLSANGEKLASMQEERDDVALGFIPDYFMTEFHYPGSEAETGFCGELERFRGYDGFERMGRSMLLNNYRFTAVDLQNREPGAVGTLVVFSASYMAAEIQRKLVSYVENGGNLMLYGRLPQYDMEGKACGILKDCLGVGAISYVESGPGYFLSVTPKGCFEGCAEVPCSWAETYEVAHAEVLMERYDTGETSAFLKEVGKGKILMLGTPYICHLANIRKMLELLGCAPALSHTEDNHGLFMTVMKNEEQEKYLHILNLDGFEKEAVIRCEGRELFGGKALRIGSRRGLMLPLDLAVEGVKIRYATGEIVGHEEGAIRFRLTQQEDVICIAGGGKVRPSEDYVVEERAGDTYVRSRKDGRVERELCILL